MKFRHFLVLVLLAVAFQPAFSQAASASQAAASQAAALQAAAFQAGTGDVEITERHLRWAHTLVALEQAAAERLSQARQFVAGGQAASQGFLNCALDAESRQQILSVIGQARCAVAAHVRNFIAAGQAFSLGLLSCALESMNREESPSMTAEEAAP
ncbi:MAG: hypothetical protein FWG66_10255 [Spirochaetes bacterium]|nr:hypothetical protein [Spirochaetota bacterium]